MNFLTKLGVIAGAIVVFFLAFLMFGPLYTVDQGEQAVVLTFGKVTGTSDPGPHMKMPLAQSVVMISTQSHFAEFPNTDYGVAKFEAYSRDQQPADIQLSVSYHVAPDRVTQVYGEYGTLDAMVYRTVYQSVPAIFKNVFGTVDAQTAIQSRAKLGADVLTALQDALKSEPVVVESVQVKDIKFSADYEAAIAAKQQATVKVQEQGQIYDQEVIKAKIVVTQAQAQADSQLAVATNAAKATQLQGEAQAAAIKAKGDAEAEVIKAKAAALANNPSLIELTKAESWNGVLPTTMIPGSAVPFIDVKPQPSPAG